MYRLSIALLIFLMSAAATAQNDLKTEFQSAVDLYDSQQYNDALRIFDKISSGVPNSRTTAALIMKAKSLIALKDYNEAVTSLIIFSELYSTSSYTDEAQMMTAKGYYELSRYLDAFKTLNNIIQNSSSKEYIKKAKEAGSSIAVNYITPGEIRDIYNLSTGKEIKPYLLLTLGKAYEKRGDLKRAEEAYTELLEKYPESEERIEASNLYQNSAVKETEGNIVAVMLPLSGSSLSAEGQRASEEILAGIKYSVYEFNQGREEKDRIGIVIKDTEMSKSKIGAIKNMLDRAGAVKAIIGPIFSGEVRETLEIFKETNLPIISPTATDNDLTVMNSRFFQGNPPFLLRGKVMAQYIYYVENKRRMAILNAIEGYSPLLASVFKEEFERLGGEIVVNQTYKSNKFSLAGPIDKIAAFAERIEGIYIPLADKIDAPAILSQLSQHSLNIDLYGNQDWLLASGFESAPNLSNKLTFTSDYFIEFNKDEYQTFAKEFNNTTKTDANRNVLYGYDTGKYILTIMRNNSGGRDAIKEKMESGITVNGFHNNLSFDKDRWNEYLNIVRYNEGKFELVDKFKAGE